ncbi:uncharacterized protein MELLADRAFT_86455 [Melampsora larici-populina 98AG31]|uniref:Amidohydrolase-related domain-containing protein n=1 Tax=Melampsora larici-populina (strain 98AG31 / pathotype 3-4-7) TaxID=747676 RepID=F4RLW2_MELLP|nr:uncharacterized protein MELLADRAFT_86455 [Melampsora larici-populina 98AG31]EGG06688.1 hypothetical protein MELLADRAFT_86455 [Melampsora larici-populina 98AG31]
METYTEIYDEFNLLTSRTILAHCIHLEQSEIDLIKKEECGFSHCPSSNFNLKITDSSSEQFITSWNRKDWIRYRCFWWSWDWNLLSGWLQSELFFY